MAKVTGQLSDFGNHPIVSALSPQLVFIPSGPGVDGITLLTSKPVHVTPAANGYFETDLEPTVKVFPARHYQIAIQWLTLPSRRIEREVLPWILEVPAAGGILGDLLRVPSNPALTWTGKEPPGNPSPGSWWLKPSGELSEYGAEGWSNKADLRGPAGYNATGAAAEDAVLASLLGESNGVPTLTGAVMRAKTAARRIYDPMDFGAVGDGATDDTARVQAAINAAPQHSTVRISRRHAIPGNITLNTKHLTVEGAGTLVNGSLVIGAAVGSREDMFWTVRGITFERTDRVPGGHGVELLKTRRGTISDCTFINTDKSVHVRPLTTAVDHDTAQIKIINNEFLSVNYALYVDRADSVAWGAASDCKFLHNTVNVAYIQHIWIKSIDGIVISDNVFFFPSYNANAIDRAAKKQNIYIGQSDWIAIKGNNLFESGQESIHLDQAKHFVISNNQLAWPGQTAPYAAIKLTGTNVPNGLINDNIISRFSGNAVDVLTKGSGTIVVKNNIMEYDPNTATYFGTPALNTFTHYGVNVDPTCTDTVVASGNDTTGKVTHNHKGSTISTVKLSSDTVMGSSKTQADLTSAGSPVFSVVSQAGGPAIFSGLIIVEVKNTDTESGNAASYVFHISRHPLGMTLTAISSHGLTTGNQPNWPSFTFTADAATNRIIATPVGSTSGPFYFFATYYGNLRLLKP